MCLLEKKLNISLKNLMPIVIFSIGVVWAAAVIASGLQGDVEDCKEKVESHRKSIQIIEVRLEGIHTNVQWLVDRERSKNNGR